MSPLHRFSQALNPYNHTSIFFTSRTHNHVKSIINVNLPSLEARNGIQTTNNQTKKGKLMQFTNFKAVNVVFSKVIRMRLTTVFLFLFFRRLQRQSCWRSENNMHWLITVCHSNYNFGLGYIWDETNFFLLVP